MRVARARGLRAGDREQLARGDRGGRAGRRRRPGAWVVGERILPAEVEAGNRILKRVFYRLAFAAFLPPASREYYLRKRAEGEGGER